jgi:hypothetical protein
MTSGLQNATTQRDHGPNDSSIAIEEGVALNNESVVKGVDPVTDEVIVGRADAIADDERLTIRDAGVANQEVSAI